MKKINENYVGLLFLACVILSLGLIGIDGSGGGFPGGAFAQSSQSDSYDQLKPFDHIILTWSGSPAATQAVTWRSHVNFKKSMAEIAPAKASPDFVNTARQILAKTTPLKIEENFVYYHSVNFTDLYPNTLYAYRVGNGSIWSEWFQFRTASRQTEPFAFLYFSDSQEEISSLWPRTLRAAILQSPDARFMIHSGDLVEHKNDEGEWDEWFNSGGWMFATLPSLPVVGNHDYMKEGGKKRSLSKFWKPQFTLPENGIAELAETSYYLDYQGTRFVVLNSNKKFKQQARGRMMDPFM